MKLKNKKLPIAGVSSKKKVVQRRWQPWQPGLITDTESYVNDGNPKYKKNEEARRIRLG
jgi:hypothetical protein